MKVIGAELRFGFGNNTLEAKIIPLELVFPQISRENQGGYMMDTPQCSLTIHTTDGDRTLQMQLPDPNANGWNSEHLRSPHQVKNLNEAMQFLRNQLEAA